MTGPLWNHACAFVHSSVHSFVRHGISTVVPCLGKFLFRSLWPFLGQKYIACGDLWFWAVFSYFPPNVDVDVFLFLVPRRVDERPNNSLLYEILTEIKLTEHWNLLKFVLSDKHSDMNFSL